jgi:hypothetical protein
VNLRAPAQQESQHQRANRHLEVLSSLRRQRERQRIAVTDVIERLRQRSCGSSSGTVVTKIRIPPADGRRAGFAQLFRRLAA